MIALMFWIMWSAFMFWDCKLYCRFMDMTDEFSGWKGAIMSIIPGSGFYCKWLVEKNKLESV